MRVRRVTVLAAATAAALALAGCSSGSGSDAPADKPASSAAASVAASPEVPPEAPAELNADNFIETIADAVSGTVSYHTAMKTSGAFEMTVEGDTSIDGDERAAAMTMSSQGMDGEIRVVDGIGYLNLGELSENKFFRVDPTDETDPMAADLESVLDQLDLVSSIMSLQDSVVSVERSGDPETIDGVEAQPYEVVVDTTKLTGPAADSVKDAGASVPKTLTYTYWIGSDGKPRKAVMDVAGSTMEATMSDWGKKVTIEAPSADEITEMPAS